MASKFKVIIVGAGVSGLTLGHALHHAGIDFVILEKGSEVAFGGGASIGLFPHGLRIMDQMGMYEDIQAITEPIGLTKHRTPNGKAFATSESSLEVAERHGYPITFFEREDLLKILYKNFPDKTKVHTSKRVADIQSESSGVTVTTGDGQVYQGDIVVGADGVHSTVRKCMWEAMEKKEPGSSKAEKDSMYADYYCAFGVSVYKSDDPEFVPGRGHLVYDQGRSGVFINGGRNKNFWFLILKFDERKTYPNVPRFTAEDTKAAVTENFDMRVTENTSVEDLWNMRTKCSVASLEEVVFDKWHVDRMVLLGDSAHKLTPNSGQGGNSAIESAAVLANLLYEAKQRSGKHFSLNRSEIRDIFEKYYQDRNSRVSDAFASAAFLTRLHAQDNSLFRVLGRYIFPLVGVDFEFIEKKGKDGTIPWEGWSSFTTTQTAWKRFSSTVMGTAPYLALLAFGVWKLRHPNATTDGVVRASAGQEQLLAGNVYNNGTLGDTNILDFIGNFLAATGSINPWAVFSCYSNLLPVGAIMAVEGFRGKTSTFSPSPWLFGVALQRVNLALGSLLYFGYSAVEASLSSTGSAKREGNRIPLMYAKSLTTAVLLSGLIPLVLATNVLQYLWPKISVGSLESLVGFLRVFPLTPWLLNQLLAGLFFSGSTSKKNVVGHSDLPHIRKALLLSAFISMVAHIGSVIRLLFTSGNALRGGESGSLILQVIGSRYLGPSLQINYAVFTIASLIWVYTHLVFAIRPERRTALAKLKLAGTMIGGSLLLGPGATMALLWTWREDTTRRK